MTFSRYPYKRQYIDFCAEHNCLRLTFNEMDYAEKNNACQKAINIITALAKVWWRADSIMLLKVCKYMVRWHLEYGCPAIFSKSYE